MITLVTTLIGFVQEVKVVTDFSKDKFLLTYLGCPVGHAKKKKKYFVDFTIKVKNKLNIWKGKLISFGGKSVLINQVFQGIPIYLFSEIMLPKFVLKICIE